SIGRRRELGGATPTPPPEPGGATLMPLPEPEPGGATPTPPLELGETGGRLVDEAIEPPSPFASTAAAPLPPAPPAPPAPTPSATPTYSPSAPPMSTPRVTPAPPLAPRAPVPQDRPAPEQPTAVGRPETGQPLSFTTPPESAQAAAAPQERAPQERQPPSDAQLASLAELRRFRDRLERFARDLADEYDALLGRVMSGLTSSARPAEPSPAVPTAAPGPEDVLFEGRVELGVGPFYDIAALTAFERQLASLAFVAEAAVRRFEASHAVVDVRLATPAALVGELRRAVDSEFSVREIADGRVLLTFDEV
ncbi:MAG TPA: hypothetical protein VNV37_05640, partial [Solirubrobacteraceae bacterium]|nr:hypothetical protein [Solirubrobacteraceae bacterium]